ncbi:MAG: hypothetical protein ACFB11_13355 [Paracoccaceae bacterium]
MYGEDGDNSIDAGDGDDSLRGGVGNNSLVGGDGMDVFVVGQGSGQDVVQDFRAEEGEKTSLNYLGINSFHDLQQYLSDDED